MASDRQFEWSHDYAVLIGERSYGGGLGTDDLEPMMSFWMNYVWSSFCLQWVAITWCAVIGDENTPTKETP